MRLHELQITAFGPFAGTVVVDFDALSDAGLFLLTGATGAGKTSVLDAVCFALYGDVPGDRAGAKRLRSDQADAGVAPRVSLECTLAGRRFRFVRSPSWPRPKKRGGGTTTQQASVTVSERVDGVWSPLSSRLDEAGHLVSGLLGMNLTQFTQVAMLPQGRFQAFLRARSEDRHRLLQHLFRTGRFESVERWFKERRLELVAASRVHDERVADLVSRISETAERPPPDDSVLAWAREVLHEAAGTATRAESLEAEAATEAEVAAAHLAAGRALADQQQRLAEARGERRRLADLAGPMAETRERLARARRAATVAPLQAAVREATVTLTAARAAAEEAVLAAERAGAPATDEASLARALADARAGAAAAEALRPQEARLVQLRATLTADRSRLEQCRAEVADLDGRVGSAPARIAEQREELTDAARAAASLPAALTRLEGARSRLENAQSMVGLDTELARATDLLRAATDHAQATKERWLEIQERRITGMAAELAGRIAVGGCCPVCGSEDHPDLAQAGAGAPDAAAEKQARRRLDDAEAARHLHDAEVRDVQTRLALATQAAGGASVAEAAAELDLATTDLGLTRSRADRHDPLAASLRTAESALAQDLADRDERRREIARLDAKVGSEQGEAEAIATRVEALLRGTPCADLAGLRQAHERVADCCTRAVGALEAAAAAQASADAHAGRLLRGARDAGFEDSAEAEAAVLLEAELELLDAQLREHDALVAAVDRIVHDPDLLVAADQPAPDLAALARTDQHATALLRGRQADRDATRGRALRLTTLHDQVRAALEAWAPVRDELEVVTRLALFVDGRSPDNRLQMRLSAYVLAARLSQVVAAANERLAAMSDRRYSLEHTARRGAGESRGGLSLVVRDDWSGEARDPATLSGGETFVVSLALALGLADVITQEVGGADLDTLFVDEGFGALDAETLEDVMDTLDSLRDGGRVVGVVSHVPEMQDRIPTQLAVVKRRNGSTIDVRRAR